jgi:ketosteroid isomerase-like protein
VSADDLKLAGQFLSVLATVANTGDRERLYPFLATDVEWLTPRRDLSGIDEVREELTWITAPENLDLDFEVRQMSDLGGGRVVTDVHELYRAKGMGEVAHTRDRRIDLTIRDGKVTRYEMQIVG